MTHFKKNDICVFNKSAYSDGNTRIFLYTGYSLEGYMYCYVFSNDKLSHGELRPVLEDALTELPK